ncbi:MAG: hypothetical protein GF346_11960 [Candidatus Eisenbacteria bacterium]|nr:hypothetical protein [Candidatus Latescibacterota bacterium]MBD3303151.1 hypothetical protein [Candidatus Eisenbacteria bacterium]
MKAPDAISWSVVLPLGRDCGDPRPLLDALEEQVAPLSGGRHGILAVDDDAPEDARAAAGAWGSAHRSLVLLRNPVPRGPGDAARHGILLAGGERILLAIDPPAIPEGLVARMEEHLDDRNDLIVASPRIDWTRPLPPVQIRRELIARALGPVASLFVGRDAPLGSCPLHLYRRQAAREIYQRIRIDGPAFEVEVLYLARRYRYPVLETPWIAAPVDRTDDPPDPRPLGRLRELMRIRYGRLRGDYG